MLSGSSSSSGSRSRSRGRRCGPRQRSVSCMSSPHTIEVVLRGARVAAAVVVVVVVAVMQQQ